MTLLVDAQLPPALVGWLLRRGLDAYHVADVDLAGASDVEIARYAEHHKLTIISKDADFTSLRNPDRFGLIWLRCGNITNPKLVAWLQPRWSAILKMLNDGERSIEVR